VRKKRINLIVPLKGRIWCSAQGPHAPVAIFYNSYRHPFEIQNSNFVRGFYLAIELFGENPYFLVLK